MSRLDLPDQGLAGDRVRLRHWAAEDLDPLVTELQDPEIPRWIPVIPSPYGRSEGEWFLNFANEERESESGAHLAIIDAAREQLLGSMAFTRVSLANRSAELGYWVAKDARGQGIATQAGTLGVDWATNALGLERLELFCHPDNVASQRVAEKLGFEREGLLKGHMLVAGERRDSLIYALLTT